MKRAWLYLFLLFPVGLSGCYEDTVKQAASKLQVGMTKSELDHVLKDVKFLKEQSVVVYPNSTEEKTRASFIGNNHYEYRNPENVIDLLTFDGNTKVLSYLIRREKNLRQPNVC